MDRKAVSEMTDLERKHHSLGGKTFRTILLISLILSAAAIAFSYFFYSESVAREFRTRTWQMSKTAAQFLDNEELLSEAEKVISVYSSMPEEQRVQLSDKHSPLLSAFDGVRDDAFEQVRTVLLQIQENNGGIAAFTAFLDPAMNRRVFIADSDPKDTFCPPGSLDEMEPSVIRDLLNGNKGPLDSLYGAPAMTATTIRMKAYGYRCMAGTCVGTVKGYPVYIFFDTDMNQAKKASGIFFWQFVTLMLVITAAGVALAVMYMNRSMVKPIDELAMAARGFSEDRADQVLDDIHFGTLDIRTGDEIENLSETMKTMEKDLWDFVKTLTQVTAEKERISTELSLATRIQAAMLPHIFPPFPGRKEIDLYAKMDPAKEVGGDFYDFFLVDDDHLCLMIADVSGKGVPAALLMMASKIILNSYAMLGLSPSEILAKANETILSNNQEEMFVTVWVGILELSTGKLVSANAGHEFPVLRRPEGLFEMVQDTHGFIIGGMPGQKYKEYTTILEPGCKLFLYTDGVPEAINPEAEQFGTERMLAALNRDPDASPEQLLNNVQTEIDGFVRAEDQFDDLTMLCVHYLQKTGSEGSSPAASDGQKAETPAV